MHDSYTRLINRMRAVTRDKPIKNDSDLARRLHLSPQRAHNWKRRGVSHEGALAAEGLFGIPADFVMNGTGPETISGAGAKARPVSHTSIENAQQQQEEPVDWGVMNADQLPDVFTAVVPDDAMADRVWKGDTARFDKRRSPTAGAGVLVSDRSGNWYLRIYVEGAGGTFSAVAKNQVYGPMESERDGLTVLAVLVGVPETAWR